MHVGSRGKHAVKLLHKLPWFRPPATVSADTSSSQVAKERLKVALTYDRGGLPRGAIEQLGNEMVHLIAKHLAIQAEEIQFQFDRTSECDRLIASIPLHTTQRFRSQTMTGAHTPKTSASRRRRRRSRSGSVN